MLIPSFDSYKRTPISPAALTLLCDFAAGDPTRPLHRVEVDWEEVFQGMCRNGLIGLTHNYLVTNHLDDYPPAEFQTAVIKIYEISALRMALMHRRVTAILQTMNQSGIPYLIVKGPVLGTTIYSEPYLRSYNDLDILIREPDWAAMNQLLIRLGFLLKIGTSDPPPRLIPQDVKQESQYISEQMNLVIEIHYDDILNAGLATRDVEGFWNRSIPIEIFGVPCKTLSLEDQLVHLCAHLHHHGYSRLVWFSDLVLILRKSAKQLDWQKLVGIVKSEEAQVPVYYSLYFLRKLLGEEIPQNIIETLRPDSFRMYLHEKIWPEDKVLSFEPLSDIYFSFYFIPLYQRLLPDFLVMGRRNEKVNYLLHLIFPSGAWLRNHYHLEDTSWIGHYHLLHPIRLLSIYVGETYNAVFRKQR